MNGMRPTCETSRQSGITPVHKIVDCPSAVEELRRAVREAAIAGWTPCGTAGSGRG